MLSRVADSVFWMNRYIERAENTARFIDVNLQLMLDSSSLTGQQWEPIVSTTGDFEIFQKKYETATQENVINFLTFDRDYPNSIYSCIASARENARTIREVISTEMWEELNKFYLSMQRKSKQDVNTLEPYNFYSEIKSECHLFSGITEATMSHSESWHFAQVGKYLERADKTSRIIDVKYFFLLPSPDDVGSPIDNIQWAALLRSVSGLEMYRKLFKRLVPINVIEFLVLNQEFPRSIHFCMSKAEDSLHVITGTPMGNHRNPAEQYLGRLNADLDYITIKEIMNYGLHEYLDNFQDRLNSVDDQIFKTFFNYNSIEV